MHQTTQQPAAAAPSQRRAKGKANPGLSSPGCIQHQRAQEHPACPQLQDYPLAVGNMLKLQLFRSAQGDQTSGTFPHFPQ